MSTAVQKSEPEIYLNEVGHQYFHKSGRELVAVTTAFEKIGITDFSKVPFDVIEPARQKGDAVHDIAAYHGLGILDESTVDVSLLGYLEGVKKFFKDEVRKVIAIEKPVFSLTHGYAGTPDIAYVDKKDLLRIDDYKSALKPHKACRFQTAAYTYAYEKMYKIKVDRRRGVRFTSDGEYFFDNHDNPLRRDFDDFVTILKAAILKIQNKIG